MEFDKRYAQLNAAQKKAVDNIEGPLMVIAGPGTGKTELLSVRTANILKKTDTLPQNILCLTYTESGAAAMRKRLVDIIGKDAYKVAIHTFHSFGTEIINQNREFFYKGALFEPADDLSQYEILRSIFDELNYKNPLASTMNGEYTHQKDASKVIAELKKSGLTSDELRLILDAAEADLDSAGHLLLPLAAERVSVKVRDSLAKVLPDLHLLAKTSDPQFGVVPMIKAIADGLEYALGLTETEHPTKPITAWKEKWFEKDADKNPIFKSRTAIVKLRALAAVYYEYLNRMEQASLFDYDDMILQVVHAMEVNDDLRYNLQEKYLYIMVDEFQDTNLAQMRILQNLTDNPANEGQPNLMVVGDDDQAIYSFQGADISNILQFKQLYPAAKLVVLTDNYRSKVNVISNARDVIVQGGERLENIIEDLNKELTAQKTGAGTVALHKAPTIDAERHWVAAQVASDIKAGTKPSEIAVLARQHSDIQSLLPYFHKASIAVNYEREESVLDQPPVMALELLSRVVVAIGSGEHDIANSMLPELLAHPAWGITPLELWQLSVAAYDNRQRWLDMMVTMPRFLTIHSWLIELAALAQYTALEPMLDRMIGRVPDGDTTQSESPFYAYFFSAEQLAEKPAQYLDYLEAIRKLRSKLREHRTKEIPTLHNFLDFLTLHRRLGTGILMSQDAVQDSDGAVHLMTAHKSKGQEFEHVYIFNAVDNVWGQKVGGRGRTINYTENLPLADAGGSPDERLRLFYVAMTRAKSQLQISYSDINDKEKSTLVANFLLGEKLESSEVPMLSDADVVELAELAWYEPLAQPDGDLRKLLEPQMQHYKLSSTHLNAFMDLSYGGPQSFLINNLLHFPSTMSPSSAYGSAIHDTLQQAHLHMIKHKEKKPLEDVLGDFAGNLDKQRLGQLDQNTYLQKGSEQLTAFLTVKYDTFSPSQKPELDFKDQESMLGEAHLTGKLDVADINAKEKTIAVTDYKTGKPSASWKGDGEYEKIKLYKYRQQLLFYKLLINNSRDYANYDVTKAELSFVEPTQVGKICSLDLEFNKEDLERLSQLIAKVWDRIIRLDLPDVSGYEPTLKGILAFENDLLTDSI